MKSDTELVEVLYHLYRVKVFKKISEYLHNLYKTGETISFKVVNIIIINTLITNLSCTIFIKEDFYKFYGIKCISETNYHELKESMKVKAISTTFECIIKQEICGSNDGL